MVEGYGRFQLPPVRDGGKPGFALVGAYVHVYNIVTQLWTDWAVFWGGGEMADAADLKSAGVNLRVGSNPTRPTHFRPFGAFFVYAR
jgi:hypothetical protein